MCIRDSSEGVGDSRGQAAAEGARQTSETRLRGESGGCDLAEKTNAAHVDGRISTTPGTESKKPSQMAQKSTGPVQEETASFAGNVTLVPVRSLFEKNEKKLNKQMSSVSSSQATSTGSETGARDGRPHHECAMRGSI